MWSRWIAAASFTTTALSGVAALYLATERGHQDAARAIERLVSDQIPGRVTIGRLERYGTFAPVLHDVRFIHPSGKTVLRLDRAAIDLDLAAMLHGQLGFHHADTSGGEIEIAVDPDGRTSIEGAFDFPTPSSGKAEDGFHYQLRRMRVHDLTVKMRVAKDQLVRILGTEGSVSVTRVTTPGVIVHLDHLSGHIDRSVLGAAIRLLDADGDITGKEKQILDLKLALGIDESRLRARARLFDRKQTPVELQLHSTGGVKSDLAALGLKLGSWFTDSVRVVSD